MDATPSPAYTYILVILLGVTFVLGLAAGYLSRSPGPTMSEDIRQQIYQSGYSNGYQAGQVDSEAFKLGYGQGYNQGVLDMQQPRTPQPRSITDPLPQAAHS